MNNKYIYINKMIEKIEQNITAIFLFEMALHSGPELNLTCRL